MSMAMRRHLGLSPAKSPSKAAAAASEPLTIPRPAIHSILLPFYIWPSAVPAAGTLSAQQRVACRCKSQIFCIVHGTSAYLLRYLVFH
jgi:hypothetical protein